MDLIEGKFLCVFVMSFFLVIVVVLYVFGMGGVVRDIFDRFLVILMVESFLFLLKEKKK